jgi:hypothetical protein
MTTLYVVEQGTELGCCGERLEVRRDDAVLQSVPLVKVEDVLLPGVAGADAGASGAWRWGI